MKSIQILTIITLAAQYVSAVAVAPSEEPNAVVARFRPPHPQHDEVSSEELWKRKGGGGGGGRGGGGGSSGGGSSGGGSSGGGSSGGSSGGGRGSPGSTTGGSTTTGSGPPRGFGGGSYYGGGARVPYKSGGRSPGGIAPFFLGAGLIAFWPGLWFHPIYYYPYTNPHSYYNASSQQNETTPVGCGCDETVECGCDENPELLREIIGNGTNLNSSLVSVAVVNGTKTILLNGTLPDGTTAPGGDEDPFGDSAGGRLVRHVAWWPLVASVCAMVYYI